MFRHSRQPRILLKNTLAALLAVTLSGVFYLVCCEAMKAAEKTGHCPLSKTFETEHCDFSKSAPEPTRTAASINLFECCQLKFSFFVAKLEKNELPQQTSALVNDFFNFPGPVKPARVSNQTGFAYRAPVFASRDLHIKNCVFRI